MDSYHQLTQVQGETNIIGSDHHDLISSVQFLGGQSVFNKRLSGFAFYYGWCGHVFGFEYSDDKSDKNIEFFVPSNENSNLQNQKKGNNEFQFSKDDSNYHSIQLQYNERIVKLLFREVETSSYEFGTNIVGTVVVLNTGKIHVFDCKEYKNHYQKCWEIDLNFAVIIGARSVWNDASHYTVANLQLLLKHQKSISTPQFQEISFEQYNKFQNTEPNECED